MKGTELSPPAHRENLWRIREWLRLARTSRGHLVHPLLKQGHLELAAQETFEYLQAWRLQNLSGQPLASFSVRQAAPWSTSILKQSNFHFTFTFHWPNNAGILIKLKEKNKNQNTQNVIKLDIIKLSEQLKCLLRWWGSIPSLLYTKNIATTSGYISVHEEKGVGKKYGKQEGLEKYIPF